MYLQNPPPLPHIYMPQGDRKACTLVGGGSEQKHSYLFPKIKKLKKKCSQHFVSMI